jgi:hypothetical protein
MDHSANSVPATAAVAPVALDARMIDILFRLVEIWYDSTWAFLMSLRGDAMVKRVNNRRRSVSSSESVASSVAEGVMTGKSFQEKLSTARESLGRVETVLAYQDYKDLCACCIKTSDNLYPGFHDILPLTQDLLTKHPRYKGKLTARELGKITVPMVYQCIYVQMCDYLTRTPKGAEAMKLLTTPTKLTHAMYDICRQKFCKLLVDEEEIVAFGLHNLVTRIIRHRRPGDEVPPPPPPVPEPTPAADDDHESDASDVSDVTIPIPTLVPRAAFLATQGEPKPSRHTKARATPSFTIESVSDSDGTSEFSDG